jgi:hypothetical protein
MRIEEISADAREAHRLKSASDTPNALKRVESCYPVNLLIFNIPAGFGCPGVPGFT